MRKLYASCVALGSLALAAAAPAAEWGTLKGQFVYDGTAPAAAAIVPEADVEFCSKHPLVDESLVVGADGGLKNVVVFVRTKKVDVHPDYEAQVGSEVVLDNAGCKFTPHVGAMWTKQKLKLHNSDTVPHNTNLACFTNPGANPLVPPGASVDQPMKLAENVPVKISCGIHKWMNGYLVVRDDPYFAVTDAEGNFEIKNLPVGEYEFQVWHERGYPTKVEFAGKAEKWVKGRFDFEVVAGDNNWGVVKVDPEPLAKK